MNKTDVKFHVDTTASKNPALQSAKDIAAVSGVIMSALAAITKKDPPMGWVMVLQEGPTIYFVKVSQSDASLEELQAGFPEQGIAVVEPQLAEA